MTRHASLKILAFYIEGSLRPRRASRVASHLAGCSRCTGSVQDLRQIPLRLSNVAFPPIPANLTHRIEMAIVAESTTRVTAAEPLSGEASRRDLPPRGASQDGARQDGARQERRRWRMPGFSSPLAGSLAAVGAAVIVAGGGYEVATHLGSGATSSGSSSSSTVHQPAQSRAAAGGGSVASGAVRPGPRVQFQHDGKTTTIFSVTTSTNFLPVTLQAQAQKALQAARLGAAKTLPGATPAATGIGARQLAGCVSNIAAGRNVLLVDLAKYQGNPATIIVVGSGPSGPGVVYAVGPACSATDTDVLGQQNLPRTAP